MRLHGGPEITWRHFPHCATTPHKMRVRMRIFSVLPLGLRHFTCILQFFTVELTQC